MNLEMTWLGAAGWLLRHGDTTIAIDPFFHRPPAARPILALRRDDLPVIDYLLATHAHYDHFADVPYLACTRARATYVPRAALRDLERERRRLPAALRRAETRWHGVVGGETIALGDLHISFHRIGTERFDLAMARDAIGKLARHGDRHDWATAVRFLGSHFCGACHAILLHDRATDRKLIFFGMLTTDLGTLPAEHAGVDVAVLPYCPANADYLAESVHVARALRPATVLVHHFDQFLPPVTVGLDMPAYARAVEAGAPGTRVELPKFCKPFRLELTAIQSRATSTATPAARLARA
ncbi:MAG TPA: MBL fold metallo-hydrolase [Kofleriaceae bacterium]|nr:MBL fold metallo-hydrolase [Kofleriaceae bacterium]